MTSTFDKLMNQVNNRRDAKRASDRAVAKATGTTVRKLDADTTKADPDVLPQPESWMSTQRASRIAADLTEGEFGESRWTYEVVPDLDAPTEYAAVAMFDESGAFVDYWNQF